MTFAFVGSDVVFLLELLAADVAGELVEGVGVVFLHVPVQGGFLAAGEAADLAPGRKQDGIEREREEKKKVLQGIKHEGELAPPHLDAAILRGLSKATAPQRRVSSAWLQHTLQARKRIALVKSQLIKLLQIKPMP